MFMMSAFSKYPEQSKERVLHDDRPCPRPGSCITLKSSRTPPQWTFMKTPHSKMFTRKCYLRGRMTLKMVRCVTLYSFNLHSNIMHT